MGKIVFVHGWGFDASFWDQVRNCLGNLPSEVVDLGFFKEPKTTSGDIYITHSMGLAWTLKNVNPRAMVSINGFTKFCSGPDWENGVHPRMLKRMIRQFDKSPENVWSDFMSNSGVDNPNFPAGANLSALTEGLKSLETWDVRKEYENFSGKKLNLASTHDRIVPEKLSTASFGEDVIWYKEGNHLLPISQAQSVADQIQEFLDRV